MRRIFLSLGMLAFGFVTAIGGAAAQDRIKAGTLVCDVSGGLGMIIGSKKGVQCLFSPSLSGPAEGYIGTITKLGLDIGATTAGQMVWAVYAPSSYGPGASLPASTPVRRLKRRSRSVSAATRWSAVPTARSRCSHLSVTGQTGLNLAAGVASLELRPER